MIGEVDHSGAVPLLEFLVVVASGLLILDVVAEVYRWNIRRREERDQERPWRGIE
jgi:hypothetical protein